MKHLRGTAVALLVILFAVGAGMARDGGAASPQGAPLFDTDAELAALEDLYRAVLSYQVVLARESVGQDLARALVFDVSHYVGEMDSRYELSRLFVDDPRIEERFARVVARAHLQAALLHAEGIDMESSIHHYRRAVELMGQEPSGWGEGLEFFGRQGELPEATELVYRIAPAEEVVKRLELFWSAGEVTRFQVQELSAAQRASLALLRVTAETDPHTEAVFNLAAERFATRVHGGREDFEVVLPPGHYRVASADGTVPATDLQVVAGSTPDPVVVNPNTFSFALNDLQDGCTPRLIHNGLPVSRLENLHYGTFVVQTGASCERRLPDKIIVTQRSEVTLRTDPERLDLVRDGQPILLFITLPPGKTHKLRF
ncbi:MAG: hypothetical protein Q9Q13_01240 [Acidobacteriota bacterium]|nr:hypothetical protein [Acidobacteriota bacterium]